jgi:hypothetical protein
VNGFGLACRNNGFSEDIARDAVLSCVRSYREHLAEYRETWVMDVGPFLLARSPRCFGAFRPLLGNR